MGRYFHDDSEYENNDGFIDGERNGIKHMIDKIKQIGKQNHWDSPVAFSYAQFIKELRGLIEIEEIRNG